MTRNQPRKSSRRKNRKLFNFLALVSPEYHVTYLNFFVPSRRTCLGTDEVFGEGARQMEIIPWLRTRTRRFLTIFRVVAALHPRDNLSLDLEDYR